MQRYFLTVGDKNPIMFNDMLCECAWVESGLQLRGPSSKVCLPSPLVASSSQCARVCVSVYMLPYERVIQNVLFLFFFLSRWSLPRSNFSLRLHQGVKDFLRITVTFSRALSLKDWMPWNTFWIAQLKSCPSQTFMLCFFSFMFPWCSVSAAGEWSFTYFMLPTTRHGNISLDSFIEEDVLFVIPRGMRGDERWVFYLRLLIMRFSSRGAEWG